MSIPEAQLETWAHQGSVTQSSSTYSSLRNSLLSSDSGYSGKDTPVFLQGSYANSTNIYSESDVDIVIKLNNTFQHDLSDLTSAEKIAFDQAFSAAEYSHSDFKQDVLSVLTSKYGGNVSVGSKSIKVAPSSSRRSADVIPAIQFRRYTKFNSTSDQSFVDGICFFASDGRRIINYPEQHRQALTAKHLSTNSRLKSTVRMLKNMRRAMVDEGLIGSDIAPSYFIEGLLFNVPNTKYSSTLGNIFVESFSWIQDSDSSKFVCPNNQYYLIRNSDTNCWPESNFRSFVNSVVDFWNQW